VDKDRLEALETLEEAAQPYMSPDVADALRKLAALKEGK
jgi:hypothetical protein